MRHAEVQAILPGRAGVGDPGGSLDAAHRARAHSRQPSLQRDRAGAARNLALAAGVNGVSPFRSWKGSQDRHRDTWRVGRPLGLWRAEAGGVGRGVIDLEDSPADQSRALAGTAYGRGVRLHRSSGTTSVVAPRASGRCRCRLACIGTSRSGIYLRPRLSTLRC
jgi:hypothetical protein